MSFLDYRSGGYTIIAADVGSGTEQVLERVYYAEPVVSTFGDRVAWIGYTAAGGGDVYVHDRGSSTTTQVTSDGAFQNHPDLSSDVLVWQDYRNSDTDGRNADIYMHEFESNVTSAVTTDLGYQDWPRTHGTRIVWQDYRHSSSLLNSADIYAYDVVRKQERRLTTGSAYRAHPAVWEDLVVWEDYRHGGDGDIYLYDLSANEELRITDDPAHQGFPSVYGDWVLWLDYRNSAEQGDLFGYNLRIAQEFALLVHPAHQEPPHIYGSSVIWQDFRDGRFDLYAGTLADPTSTGVEAAEGQSSFRLSAAPNPFTESVQFILKDAPTGSLEVAVYDALGRAVVRREISSLDSVVSWDGRNEHGRPVAAGVYVVVVRRGDLIRHTLVVRHM